MLRGGGDGGSGGGDALGGRLRGERLMSVVIVEPMRASDAASDSSGITMSVGVAATTLFASETTATTERIVAQRADDDHVQNASDAKTSDAVRAAAASLADSALPTELTMKAVEDCSDALALHCSGAVGSIEEIVRVGGRLHRVDRRRGLAGEAVQSRARHRREARREEASSRTAAVAISSDHTASDAKSRRNRSHARPPMMARPTPHRSTSSRAATISLSALVVVPTKCEVEMRPSAFGVRDTSDTVKTTSRVRGRIALADVHAPQPLAVLVAGHVLAVLVGIPAVGHQAVDSRRRVRRLARRID